MNFIASVRARAREARRRVLFPESADARTLAAVRAIAADGMVEPVLILDRRQPDSHAEARRAGVATIDPATDSATAEITQLLLSLIHI